MVKKITIPALIAIVILTGFFFVSAVRQARAANVINTTFSDTGRLVIESWMATDPYTSSEPAAGNDNPNGPATGNDNPVGPAIDPGPAILPNFMGVETITDLILKIVDFLIILAIPFAIFMLIWAGFQFATAQGSDTKLATAKKNLLWTVAGIAIILASQAIVDYISEILGGGTGQSSALMNKIKITLNEIIILLFVLVTVYFFWGIVQFVRATSGGDATKIKEGKKHMDLGIIGMAVMAGAWGIVNMIKEYVQ